MKRTTNGFERRTAPSPAPHPDFQVRASQPKPQPDRATESWWIQPTREAFSAQQRIEQARLSATSLSAKQAKPNDDL